MVLVFRAGFSSFDFLYDIETPAGNINDFDLYRRG